MFIVALIQLAQDPFDVAVFLLGAEYDQDTASLLGKAGQRGKPLLVWKSHAVDSAIDQQQLDLIGSHLKSPEEKNPRTFVKAKREKEGGFDLGNGIAEGLPGRCRRHNYGHLF